MQLKSDLIQSLSVDEAAATVLFAVTVIVPVALAVPPLPVTVPITMRAVAALLLGIGYLAQNGLITRRIASLSPAIKTLMHIAFALCIRSRARAICLRNSSGAIRWVEYSFKYLCLVAAGSTVAGR